MASVSTKPLALNNSTACLEGMVDDHQDSTCASSNGTIESHGKGDDDTTSQRYNLKIVNESAQAVSGVTSQQKTNTVGASSQHESSEVAQHKSSIVSTTSHPGPRNDATQLKDTHVETSNSKDTNGPSSKANSGNNISQGATTFHPFPKMPPELRNMVWELASLNHAGVYRFDAYSDYPTVPEIDVPPVPQFVIACKESYSRCKDHYVRSRKTGRPVNLEYSVISFVSIWYINHPMTLQPAIRFLKAQKGDISEGLSAQDHRTIAQSVVAQIFTPLPKMIVPLPRLMGINSAQILRRFNAVAVPLSTQPFAFDALLLGTYLESNIDLEGFSKAATKKLVKLVLDEFVRYCSKDKLKTVYFVVGERRAGVAYLKDREIADYSDYRMEKGYEDCTVRSAAFEGKVSEIRAKGIADRDLMSSQEEILFHIKQEDDDIKNLEAQEWRGMYPPQILRLFQKDIEYWFNDALKMNEAGDSSYPSWIPGFRIVFKKF